MADVENPYQSDLPAERWFVGRNRELADAVAAVRTGRHGLRAFMGGRGMGKSSLLGAIERQLRDDEGLVIVRVDRPSRDPRVISQTISARLGFEEPTEDLPASLGEHLRQPSSKRLCLLIDEVESLLDTQSGQDFVENLRTVYEQAPRRLSVFVFGGVRLRVLLTSNASPFLRTAKLHVLRGFERAEVGQLMRAPLALEVDETTVELVWEHTNGHPLLVQRVMENATDRAFAEGVPVPEHIRAALSDLETDSALFPVWWENLTTDGQRVFRRLVAQRAPVPDEQAALLLGDRPFEWIEVLESAGVARRSERMTAPRGELFRQWFTSNFAPHATLPDRGPSDLPWASLQGVTDFERDVITAVSRWVRSMLEHPAYAIRIRPGKKGNELLQEEDFFQISLLQALHQHGWEVEAEALSVGRKLRADLKIRTRDDQRTCGEVKRWTGTPTEYKGLVTQVLTYAMETDAFAFTVMVDRSARSLPPVYADECIPTGARVLWPAPEAPDTVRIPAFLTEHDRQRVPAIRVYHFVVQLPPD